MDTKSSFTHIDKKGHVRMVDVTDKKPSERIAVAQGVVSMKQETFEMIQNQKVKKGNVLEAARIAGVMAAKKTSDLIPMCHPLNITHMCKSYDRGMAISDICLLKKSGGKSGMFERKMS